MRHTDKDLQNQLSIKNWQHLEQGHAGGKVTIKFPSKLHNQLACALKRYDYAHTWLYHLPATKCQAVYSRTQVSQFVREGNHFVFNSKQSSDVWADVIRNVFTRDVPFHDCVI